MDFHRRNEVTLRLERGSGAETEMHKLLEDLGDALFYGWGDSRMPLVIAYSILDLHQCSLWLSGERKRTGKLPEQGQHDREGSAACFPLCLVVAWDHHSEAWGREGAGEAGGAGWQRWEQREHKTAWSDGPWTLGSRVSPAAAW